MDLSTWRLDVAPLTHLMSSFMEMSHYLRHISVGDL
jgi:hypothetical protein